MTWTIAIVILLFYLAANVGVYLWQERLLFKPEKLPADFEYKYANQQFKEHNIDVGPGVNINGIHFHIEKPKGIVFYLKGNSRSIKGWGEIRHRLRTFGL